MGRKETTVSADVHRIAEASLAWLGQRGIPPTPDHFRVAFTYLAGEDPTLSAAIAAMSEQGGGPDAIQSRALYERFFSGGEAGSLQEHGRRLADLVGRLQGELATAGQETRECGQALATMRAQVAKPLDVGRVGELLARITEETDRMQAIAARLEGGLASGMAEIGELRRSLQAARTAALTDPLTGLANRKRFDLALASLAAEALAERRSLSLIMADVDHFKAFNDLHGHRMGDLVLKLVASLLVEHFKGRDVVARYGGEEFAVILPDTDLAAAQLVADRLRETLASRQLQTRDKTRLGRITISLGVAELATGEPLTDLVERADRALYAAKRSGRNRTVALAAGVT